MSELNKFTLENSLVRLENYVHSASYSGWDPYDALNSDIISSLNNKYIKLAATQTFVYSPINLRNLFCVKQGINPKGAGLFISAYCKMHESNTIDVVTFNKAIHFLVDFLLKNKSNGYSGYCWGFNFPWQDLTRYSEKGLPTIVITSYVGNSFLDLYEITKAEKYLDISKSCCKFIINDLNITENERGICFSYTPIDDYIVHNANLLGTSLLSRVYSKTNDKNLLDLATKSVDFSISYQENDGSWAYSINKKTGKCRYQIDFHQGFILDSLCDYVRYAKPNNEKYKNAIINGVKFYMNKQFNSNGCSKWRYPRRYPVDIHNQAQGIITLSKIYKQFGDEKYLRFAEKIASWTIQNMQDDSGYFYYHKWPLITNKIPYMRWGQAWMMLALSNLCCVEF